MSMGRYSLVSDVLFFDLPSWFLPFFLSSFLPFFIFTFCSCYYYISSFYTHWLAQQDLLLLPWRVWQIVLCMSQLTKTFSYSCSLVDGGAWRIGSVGSSQSEWKYPDFLLSDKPVTGVKGGKKSGKDKDDKSAKTKQGSGPKL